MIKINYQYTILFPCTVAGVGTAADSTPAAVLWRNGSASGVSVLVATTAQTGLYKAVFTTDSGWSNDDFLELYVTATIAGTAGYLAKVWSSTEIGASVLDSSVRVKLDATQPDYAPLLASGYTAPANSDITAIKAKTDNLPSDPADQSLIIAATDAVMTRLGAPAGASIAADIAAIDGGGGGGGDATLAKQEEILTAVESVVETVAAYAARMALEVQLRGFPNVICRNADYLQATESEIRITVEDLTGAAITEIAGTPVASLSWLFGMGTEQNPALIAGTCSWDGDSDELVIEITKEATAAKQTGSLTWQIGVTIDTKKRWLGGGTTRLIERQF